MATKVQETTEIRFRTYDQNFEINIPVLASELVKNNALVQIIDEIVDKVDIKDLEVYYCGQGSPPYHPKMLIRVWIYGYCQKVYTARPLAKKLREDIGFIWLSGNQQPSFKTLCSFRSNQMKEIIDVIFKNVLTYLVEHGYVDLNDLYMDGSKWEANANKYQRVWRKNTERYKGTVLNRIGEILKEYEALQIKENSEYGVKDMKEHQDGATIKVILSSSDLQTCIEQMAQEVETESHKAKQKKVQSLKRALEREQPKLKKYEEQEQKLGKRNSYSKTDEDATMMRMKNDLLLPGYNVQVSSNNQYAINVFLYVTRSHCFVAICCFRITF